VDPKELEDGVRRLQEERTRRQQLENKPNEEKRKRLREATQRLTDKRKALGLCYCGQAPATGKKLCQECLDKCNTASKIRAYEQKKKAIQYYGGCCACCGLDFLPFLALDHVVPILEGNRRKLKGDPFYRQVVKEKPSGLQVLCHNCNGNKRDKKECDCPYRGGLRSK
jgi:hypothetical protein